MKSFARQLNITCFLLLALCSCAHPGAISNQTFPPPADSNDKLQTTVAPSEITDPTCCGLDHSREGLTQAWLQFTESGQFRLARRDEMNFPEIVKKEWASDWESVSKTFKYAWGKRGFDTDKDHLVAIMVDTTRDDPERFGLVIFSSARGSNEYRPYWLYRSRDLSRTMIHTPSGYLTFTDYNEDGTKGSCDVFWNPKSRQYYCKSTKG